MFKLGYNLKNNSKKQKLLSYQIQIGLVFEQTFLIGLNNII